MRQRVTSAFKRSHHSSPRSRRPVAGSDEVLKIGLECNGGQHALSIKALDWAKRTQQCAFCGRQKAAYRCRECKMHLCLKIPMTNRTTGISYPVNGTLCWHRFHGATNYPKG